MCVDRYRRRHRLRTPSTVLGDGAPAIVWEGILQLQVMRAGIPLALALTTHNTRRRARRAVVGANG